ncbi:hypothetical protein [Motilibacter aurantiacus]|uniref:hypothetical protein n=1 Tax=Motilibacter aurantiacus TaxID=2714955 RepID=UPI00140B13A7|nr:hypothetical protein [Motilibacter aurantiacus]NHC47129.1 hypothetical protein [Motilibacter aurantiacus]
MIEDFHKVPAEEKTKVAQALKVFSDLGADYPSLKIVAVGATETAREVVEYDREMSNRVAEVLVPMMTDAELHEILTNGEQLLNLDMTEIRDEISGFSVGLASVCHHLALNACLAAHVEATATEVVALTAEDLAKATSRYVDESSDTLKGTFDRALVRHKVRRFDNCRLILAALAAASPEGLLHAEPLTSIRAKHADYPPGNLTSYLRQLVGEERGSVLRHGTDGRFRFAEPLYHAYAQARLDAKIPQNREQSVVWDALKSSLQVFITNYRDAEVSGVQVTFGPPQRG